MPKTASTWVAQIKEHYPKAMQHKLKCQEAMAHLRDDHGWTQMRIVEATGISQSTVQRWLAAYDGNTHMGNPIVLTPPDDRARSDRAVAKRVLAEAELEHVEQILSELPKERQEKIAAATGDAYYKAKHKELDRKKQQTPEEYAQERADVAALQAPFLNAAGELTAHLVIGEHLQAAAEEVEQLQAQNMLTHNSMLLIESYNERWEKAWTFAKQLAGWEE